MSPDPIIESIKAHWNTLRAGRIAPFRTEINPSAIVAALGNMFILERINPGDVRIRLAGLKICNLMGMEVRGMPLTSFMAADSRAQLDAVIEVVLDHPSTAELSLIASDANGNSGPASLLLLPLRSDFGDISRVIGCLCFEDQVQRPPVTMTISGQTVKPVEVSNPAEVEYPLPGFYEDATKFEVGDSPVLRKVIDNRTVKPSGSHERAPQIRLVHSSSKRHQK